MDKMDSKRWHTHTMEWKILKEKRFSHMLQPGWILRT